MESHTSTRPVPSRAARRRAKKQARRASKDDEPSRKRKQPAPDTPASAMRWEDVLAATDADEVAERLFELANASHVLYRVAGGELSIRQDHTVANTGGCVWDTSFVLARWAEPRIGEWRASLDPPRPLRVVEVGAGCGLLGAALARLGCEVLVTEQPSAMANLRANVEANQPPASSSGGGSLAAAQLSWADEGEVAAAAARGPWDLLVGTDVVYSAEAVEPLLRALHACARKATVVWLCLQEREPAATARLRCLAPRFFARVSEVALGADDLPHSAGVECFLLRLDRRRKRPKAHEEAAAAPAAAAAAVPPAAVTEEERAAAPAVPAPAPSAAPPPAACGCALELELERREAFRAFRQAFVSRCRQV